MTDQPPSATVREIASDVFCLGPWGRTQTVVYFVRSGSSWTLVDTGWAADAARIEAAAASLTGRTRCPSAILLTHCHPDHAGAARDLALAWNCQVYLHPMEDPIANGDFAAMKALAGPLDRWVILPVLRAMSRARRDAVLARSALGDVVRVLDPDGDIPELPGWRAIPTPGHTPGHLSFFRPEDRVTISGDALVTLRLNSAVGLLLRRQGLSAPPWYTTWNRAVAAESIRTLAALEPSVLASGHGTPLTGPQTSEVIRAFAAAQR